MKKLTEKQNKSIFKKMHKAICKVYDETEDSNIKELLEEYTYLTVDSEGDLCK